MTGSGWLDALVIALAVLAAVSGWRQGAVASAIAFFGVLLGAVAGILIAPHVLVHMEDGRARVLVGVLLIITLVVIGEIAGMVLGRALRGGIRHPAARSVDSAIGACLQAVAVLVAAWLLAIPLTTSSQPLVASSVRGSKVLATVDNLAPEWMRELPKEFSALLDTSGLPDVIGPFSRTPVASVGPPDPAVLGSSTARALQASVLRIRGIAPSCQRALEGSGFVIAPERVITNAHVIAGTAGVSVDTADGTLPARVVLFDPSVDVAILSVPGLTAAPIPFAPDPADPGQDAIVLGYPGGGPYTATAARVRETVDLSGPNIYRDGTVEREVYTVRGSVRQGNSGGPLVDVDGRALGVVFGAAVDNSDTGFVLTMKEVGQQVAVASKSAAAVDTGDCII